MASYGCCTSRDPPSPDGLPPRPYFGESSSKDPPQINSWSTASAFSRLEDAAQLREIFENDKLDCDNERANLMTKKSTSTLNAVKSKLRKHLSLDSIISKHWPRPAFMINDQYVEGHKDIKLARNHRRQQELSNESSYDEDARSLATITSNSSPSHITKSNYSKQTVRSGIAYPNTTPLHLLKQKSEAGIYELWGVSSISHNQRRRHSLDSINSSKDFESISKSTDYRLQISVPTIPHASTLKPRRSPSVPYSATRQTSWRLAFASEDRAGQLRSLSQEHRLPTSESIPDIKLGETSPLKWLRNQGMSVLTLGVAKLPCHSSHPQTLPSDTAKLDVTDDYGGVDGSDEMVTPSVHLHQMQISRRLASKGLHNSSSPQLSSWGSRSNLSGWHFANRVSGHGATSPNYHFLHTTSSDVIPKGSHAHPEDMVTDATSSFYPSARNSVQPTRHNSQSQLPQSEIEHSECQLKNRDLCEIVQGAGLETKITGNSLKCASIGQNRGLRTSSLLPDPKTYGFKEREAKLDGDESRFPKSLTRSRHVTPIRSKFKEDFGNSQTTAQAAKQKTHLLFRTLQIPGITKLTSRTRDGAGSLELHTARNRAGFRFSFSDCSPSLVQPVSPVLRNPIAIIPNSTITDPLSAQHDIAEAIYTNAIMRTQEELASQIATQRLNSTRKRTEGSGSFLFAKNPSARPMGRQATAADVTEEELETLPGGMDYELFDEVESIERKTETKMRLLESAAGFTKMVLGQGNSDLEGEEVNGGGVLLMGVADPKFYDDCVSLPVGNDVDEDRTSMDSVRVTSNVKSQKSFAPDNEFSSNEKHQTSIGQNRTAQQFRGLLRRSTIDFQVELEKLEMLEKDRLIIAAEKAWGADRK